MLKGFEADLRALDTSVDGAGEVLFDGGMESGGGECLKKATVQKAKPSCVQ